MRWKIGVSSLVTDLGCSMAGVTPYPLCDYRCAYCVTGVQGASRPMMSAQEAVRMLGSFLDTAQHAPIVLLGALSDAFPSAEREFGVTRALMEELVTRGVPFAITTKSTLILRDLDLLVAHGERAYVQVSICSTDDDILARIDPGAPSATERFGVLDELHRAGVRVGLNLLPWIPGISDTEAIAARVPGDAEVVVGPLAFGLDFDTRRLLGRTYAREEVWRAYMDEYFRFGNLPNTSWIQPSLPPEENNPIYRLPRLDSDDSTSAATDAWADIWRRTQPEWAAQVAPS